MANLLWRCERKEESTRNAKAMAAEINRSSPRILDC
jgi:hypothetical protein